MTAPRKFRKPRANIWADMTPEMREKSIAGIRQYQYKPGQSGNPNGNPGGGTYNLDRALRKRLSDPQLRAKIVETIIGRALVGDIAALKLISERTGGALMANALTKEMEAEAGESNARTILYSDEEEAQELQPAGQAENDEDEE